MSTELLRLLCLVILVSSARAAPKPLSCLSYLEDDKSLEDDDDFDEYSSSGSQSSPETSAAESFISAVPHRRICQADYTFCFSLWRQTENGTSHIEKQGCWKESTDRNATCSQKHCTSSAPTSRNNSLYYCCCSGDVCNENVAVVEPTPLQLSKEGFPESSNLANARPQRDSVWEMVFFWCSILAIGILISVFATYFYCSNVKEKTMPEEAPLAPSGPGYSSNLRNVDNMDLVCMLGSGKYGTVMKGILHDEEVAVKIFPEAHHQYYINERNIYSLPLMDSPSLLTYFGYDERRIMQGWMEGKVEYMLVLSLAPLGCLQDWLIVNEMDFETFCGMAKSITHGLSHLHTEMRRGDELKPCIAHRDLNSRNVLVKADRTCCIADFGFALKVFGSKYEYKGEVAMAETKSINEVGTLRYMAPELLEGAVNLRDCETSLKQMDVYSLGLVLWEVATRCADFYPPAQIIPPYKAPYELEVGAHPTFDQMQALVVRHKARPLFPAGWGGGAATKLVKDTCEDCWDHDAEARLTSLCAEERMQEVVGLRPRLHPHAQTASPLLRANNLVSDVVPLTPTILSAEPINPETTTMLHPPPNQQIHQHNTDNGLDRGLVSGIPQTEKNHLMHPQQQLQPYQGRNPCQERNLAPVANHTPQILVEKSKKHSFQSGQENSFSCLEDDVSVEDLISGGSSKKFCPMIHHDASSMGQGFPKQHNTDKKLRGWHGVRALIQKKLFRKDGNDKVFQQLGCGDEKSNLVDNRVAILVKGLDKNALTKAATVSYIDGKQRSPQGVTTTKSSILDSVFTPPNRRPNNLDLSPMAARGVQLSPEFGKSNLIHSITEETANTDGNANMKLRMQSLDTRISTPCHVVHRSISTSLIKNVNSNNNNNNNNNVSKGEMKTPTVANLRPAPAAASTSSTSREHQFRRQHSLEVFREVFSGRGSTDKLRDVSQRVKTPGDVPPSVRKVRASKTLSLYDDRMMDSSTLNIL